MWYKCVFIISLLLFSCKHEEEKSKPFPDVENPYFAKSIRDNAVRGSVSIKVIGADTLDQKDSILYNESGKALRSYHISEDWQTDWTYHYDSLNRSIGRSNSVDFHFERYSILENNVLEGRSFRKADNGDTVMSKVYDHYYFDQNLTRPELHVSLFGDSDTIFTSVYNYDTNGLLSSTQSRSTSYYTYHNDSILNKIINVKENGDTTYIHYFSRITGLRDSVYRKAGFNGEPEITYFTYF